MSSPPIEEHQGCTSNGTNVERVISGGTGLIFKGTGFYLTDYKKSDGKDSSDKKSSDVKKSKKSKKTNKKKTEGKTS